MKVLDLILTTRLSNMTIYFIALMERKLIGKNIPANKLIREYLRSKGKEEEFTLLQGKSMGTEFLRRNLLQEC